ncbi:UNC119-binding protein C5orf30 homolog [Scleropages formosus]|uniref:Macrophage immunometabolism regulator n=1 Tax=Scleropages formosus TaxID=113540 RepID=A0A8C9SCC5_SCLFO|nr:UNC119-binding protein C5orf30 homolog [Scleropages formosus]XP_018613836.1 UNC119-binding protein C5orf30 homolog [Scleropages formosus]
MSVKVESDIGGAARSAVSILPGGGNAVASEADRPRCSSTPCSPIRSTVSGYHILCMDPHYLVGFTTGEELLKAAHRCSSSEQSADEARMSLGARPSDSAPPRHAFRVHRTRNRCYQPYEIPAANGRRRRRMPSIGDGCLRPPSLVPLQGPLPLCLLNGKRTHSRSLDQLNLDRMSSKEQTDTEVLQKKLQHLTLRGEHKIKISMT